MFVCLYEFSFKCRHSWGAVPTPVERKEKDQGGSYETSIQFARLGGLEKIRLQIADSSVDHCC